MSELYENAVQAVITERKCSASFIQRRFSIGYNKAANLVEQMEEAGVVGPPNHIGKRDILIEAPAETDNPQVTITVGETKIEGTTSEIKDALKTATEDQGKFKPDPDFDEANNKAYRVTARELRAFIERFERLQKEKEDIAQQQKEVMGEAKSRGYDTKTLRKIIALRKKDPAQISEEEAILELYKEALGM